MTVGTYAAHDISDGGLATASLEMLFHAPQAGLGLELTIPAPLDTDKVFFGEAVPRVLLAYEPAQLAKLEPLVKRHGLTLTRLGQTTADDKLTVRSTAGELLRQDLGPIRKSWRERWKTLFE